MPYAHPEPLFLRQTTANPHLHRRCSDTVLSQSLWDPWVLVCTRFVWALWTSLVGMGFDTKREFAPPTILLGLLLCPWMWGIFSKPLQRLPCYWFFFFFFYLGRVISSHGHCSWPFLPCFAPTHQNQKGIWTPMAQNWLSQLLVEISVSTGSCGPRWDPQLWTAPKSLEFCGCSKLVVFPKFLFPCLPTT